MKHIIEYRLNYFGKWHFYRPHLSVQQWGEGVTSNASWDRSHGHRGVGAWSDGGVGVGAWFDDPPPPTN